MKVGVLMTLVLMTLHDVTGNGRMVDPPSRSSMWRYGFNTPVDYNDNSIDCGGFYVQWFVNNGQCGVCGDPWDQAAPRDHEAGGRYGTGVITRSYTPGQAIDVHIEVTANHLGWFEFRLCVHNNPSKPITHQCLDQNLLQLADGSGTRYMLDAGTGDVTVKMLLPPGVTCTQCVLQWKWHAANNYGMAANGTSCVGCSPAQEEFYGCSDISIGASSQAPPSFTSTLMAAITPTAPTPSPTTLTPLPFHPITAQATTFPPFHPLTPAPPKLQLTFAPFHPITLAATTPGPPQTATPSAQTSSTPCHAINAWLGMPHLDLFCQANCPGSYCPNQYCSCGNSSASFQSFPPILIPGQVSHHSPTTAPIPTPRLVTTTTTTTPPSTTTTTMSGTGMTCHGINTWLGNPILDQWCTDNCNRNLCPMQNCACSGQPPASSNRGPPTATTTPSAPITLLPSAQSLAPMTGTPFPPTVHCHAVGLWTGQPSLDLWCQNTCTQFGCDPHYCSCSLVP